MTGSPWPEPIAGAADRSAIIRRLWASAQRVDAAVSDAPQLCDLVAGDGSASGPSSVRLVTTAHAPVHVPACWSWTRVPETPVPEFLLFYLGGGSFPTCALILSGGLGPDGWATVHRRPFVLNRLRERFVWLASASRPSPVFAVAVREEPPKRTDGSEDREASRDVGRDEARRPRLEFLPPRALYRRVLAAHFANAPRDGPAADRRRGAPSLAVHQERAYERACDILDRYGGVIVADAVGLGKTYIGLRLLERNLDSGGAALVIVPAALRDQWRRQLAYMGQAYTASSRGSNPPAVCAARGGAEASADPSAGQHGDGGDNTGPATLDLWVREEVAPRLSLLSMESLGRRAFHAAAYQGADLVLVDEAHNFRNSATRRYRNLSAIVRHSRVVMLTATPVNNTILDLQHLIDLFAAPGAFRHLGVPDYRQAFRCVAAAEGDATAHGQISAIVAACVLRRTRRFVRQYYDDIRIRDPLSGRSEELRFPQRTPPVAIEYDLAGIYGDLFARLEEWFEQLRFPVIAASERESEDDAAEDGLREGHFGDGESGMDPDSPAELLKIILLKRLESSMAAFRGTVIQQLAWCSTALRAIDAGRVLTRPDYRATFRGPADDPGSQLTFFELMLPAPSIDERHLAEFRRWLEHDQAILAHIHAALSAVGPDSDCKLQRLLDLLDGPLAGLKTIVFTEFRDTARYLHHQLRNRPHIAQIDSGGARLGLDRASRRDVIERFAPRSNGLREPPARERVDLLIATDVLSEGLNLQDASAVVSYDLPWNPVRLMQRVGRIDRLGSVAESVSIHHFVPAKDLDRLLGLMGRLQRKLSTIHSTLGLDQPVLAMPGGPDATLEQVRVLARDPSGLERVEREIEGPVDPEEQAYIDAAALLRDEQPTALPGYGPMARAPGMRAVAVCTVGGAAPHAARAAAYWRLEGDSTHRGLWLVYDHVTGSVVEDQPTALAEFRCALNNEPLPAPDALLVSARQACARYARSVAACLEAARIAGDALSPGLPQCRLAAWLSRHLQVSAHRMTPEERVLIDRLHEQLAFRFTAAGERALAGLANDMRQSPEPRFLQRLDETLQSLEPATWTAMEPSEVAVLLIVARD